MCKYCKRLKQLKDLDEKEYLIILGNWKSHAYRMEKLLKRIDEDLLVHFEYMARFFPDSEEIMKLSLRYRNEIWKLITKPWIGK